MGHQLNDNRSVSAGIRVRGRHATALGLGLCLWLGAGIGLAQPDGVAQYQAERSREDYGRAATGEDDYDYAAQSLRVSVWLDRDEDEVYRRGDEQRVVFQTNEDAYAVVYRIDTDGLVTVLWPRDRLDDGFVFGGHEYRLPGRESAALRIDESEGEGYVQAVVSRYPFDLRPLELDFLGDDDRGRYDFHVAGDPFLAMNEVNYAVTGLENSADHVITNHARYYVHRVVDHPRYLCMQCHTDDSPRYDPYAGNCTLDIDYDYNWSNNWYSRYGYYPVYWNPVYVYVDPWTWRPWVNFWYDPWYVCAPWQGWRSSYWDCYTWYDSPYYRGGCGTGWEGGGRRYHPLNRHGDSVAVRKSREHDTVTRQVTRTRLDPNERDAMVARRPLAGRGGKGSERIVNGASPVTVARGDKPLARKVERYTPAASSGRGGGLRIRPGSSGDSQADAGSRPDKPTRRHTSAGNDQEARMTPVRPVARGADNGSRRPAETGTVRPGDTGSQRDGDRDGVRALNPRQRGSRVWNSTTGRSNQPSERNTRPDRPVRSRTEGADDNRGSAPAESPRGGSEARPGRDGGQRRQPAESSNREGAAPRANDSGSRKSDDSRRGSQVAPQPSREAPRQGRESTPAPAPARQEPVRRQESPRARGGEEREAPKADDAKPADNAARRSPNAARK
jgi:hypothetical protein